MGPRSILEDVQHDGSCMEVLQEIERLAETKQNEWGMDAGRTDPSKASDDRVRDLRAAASPELQDRRQAGPSMEYRERRKQLLEHRRQARLDPR
eukprot:3161565-Pyramimonas_sp.AAC.1